MSKTNTAIFTKYKANFVSKALIQTKAGPRGSVTPFLVYVLKRSRELELPIDLPLELFDCYLLYYMVGKSGVRKYRNFRKATSEFVKTYSLLKTINTKVYGSRRVR